MITVFLYFYLGKDYYIQGFESVVIYHAPN